MTTFDGSTRQHGTEWTQPGAPVLQNADPVIDSLDLLRGELEAKQAEVIEPTIVDVPGGTIRLVCSGDIESRKITSWQRKAMPPKMRKSMQPSPLDVDQVVFNSAILIDTCERLEVWKPLTEEWTTITDRDGNLLGFKDQTLLQTFKVIDPAAAIAKLFPRDIDLIHAGQAVLRGAGWSDQDGDYVEDPS